jgi:redox-sensing transcriptional repressor
MINNGCIIRLSRYKNALYRLKSIGFVRSFSENLADATGVTAAQVRKDFSLFGITGNKRGGYTIDALLDSINSILGKDTVNNVIIAGDGNIGSALAKYKGFEKEGIKILAVFDTDETKINRKLLVPVLPSQEMKGYIKKNSVKIGIVSVPDNAAQEVADTMIAAGIKGILNFAPIRLRVPENVAINNINVAIELENVIYNANMLNKSGKK